MQDDIYSRLSKAYEGAARCKKIETMLVQMRLEKNKLEEVLPGFKQAMAKENLDVYELESKGASSFLHSVFGDMEKKLKKERGEALIARFKCRQVEKELEEIIACIESLEAERKKLEGCGEEYRRLYKQKLQVLLRKHGPSAERVMELVEDINNAKSFLKEVRDAAAAGKEAMRYLYSAQDNLTKAEQIGVFDMANDGFSNGKTNVMTGMIEGCDKYRRIDSAGFEAGIAQSAIEGFKSQLANINMKISNPDIGVVKPSRWLRVFDVGFDKLMVDWYAQKQIGNSLHSVNISIRDVQEKVTILKTLEIETERRMNELKAKLDNIILGLQPDQEHLSENIKSVLE